MFCLSAMPGLAHMYLGLIKRGLFYTSVFALSLTVSFNLLSPIAAIATVVVYAIAFFEAFKMRRDMVMGKEVHDTIPDISILSKNKSLLTLILVIVGVMVGFNVLTSLRWFAWMIIGIVAICYMGMKISLAALKYEKPEHRHGQDKQ